MSKGKSSHRVFSREFKVGIVRRMLAGENVSGLASLFLEHDLFRKPVPTFRDHAPAVASPVDHHCAVTSAIARNNSNPAGADPYRPASACHWSR
jgi:hypothetical protein